MFFVFIPTMNEFKLCEACKAFEYCQYLSARDTIQKNTAIPSYDMPLANLDHVEENRGFKECPNKNVSVDTTSQA